MSDVVKLSTLGGLEVRVGDGPVPGLGGKGAALLVYLACTRRPHSREVLAELLWDEREAAQARSNLRVVLSRLPQALGPSLSVTRETVAFDRSAPFRFDLDDFERHLHAAWEPGRAPGSLSPEARAHLESAVALYGGVFLAGFSLPGAGSFESWMAAEQERLRRQVTTALHSLVTTYLASGEHEAGVRQATRLLDLDPLDEEAQRQLMRLLAAQGQRGAALGQYDVWKRRLDEELGAEPEAQTVALAEQIRAGGLEVPVLPQAPVPPVPSLPRSPTTFVGREAELTELAGRLKDPACQLLTVIGPGGSGKTRLALEVAGRLPFPDGVFFVPLVEVQAPEGVVPSIAGTLGLTARDGAGLRGWARDRQVLLVLDNFEHLGPAAPLLSDLLQRAPGLKLLVTSREALHLQAEWLLDLSGLELPGTDSAADIEDSAAVRLFVQSARRAQARFALDEANTADVVRICRLVSGSPLGIELAAAWVRVQDCATIAREIERDLDFLTSPLRDVPERHRSLRAVFEYSWRLLGPAEQEALRRLAVFRGGFEPEAAREVAGVGAPLLAGLLDRSMLGRTGHTRYELHELLRHFAEEKLAALPEEHEALHTRHVAYYQQVVAALPSESTPISPEAWEQWDSWKDVDNLRAALEREAAEQPIRHLPQPRDYPIHIGGSVVIACPLEEVFAFLGNLENDPQWLHYTGTVASRYLDRGPVGVGTHVESTVRILGRRRRLEAVITDYVPNVRISVRSVAGPAQYHTHRTFEAVPGGTRFEVWSGIDLSASYRIVQTVVARVAQRALDLELDYLRSLLEPGEGKSLGNVGRWRTRG